MILHAPREGIYPMADRGYGHGYEGGDDGDGYGNGDGNSSGNGSGNGAGSGYGNGNIVSPCVSQMYLLAQVLEGR